MPLLHILLVPGFHETGTLKRCKSCTMVLFNEKERCQCRIGLSQTIYQKFYGVSSLGCNDILLTTFSPITSIYCVK